MESEGERLQKVLARAGWGSRRHCEEIVAAGRVTVNGRVAELGGRAHPERDRVEIDGMIVDLVRATVVYALHKPSGVVTTAADPEGRPIVIDLVPPEPRVFPVGRLDAATEGLLLLTNDGDLAHLIAHPSHGIDKTYLVEADGDLNARVIGRLEKGVDLDDGRTAPASVEGVRRLGRLVSFEITIHEGRNRQVRRMVEAIGGQVTRLVRLQVGPIKLGRLKAGDHRRLEPLEVDALRRSAIVVEAP